MKQTMETLRWITENSEDLIFVLDPSLLIQHVNDRASSCIGRSSEDLIGKPFNMLFPQNGNNGNGELRNLLPAVFDTGDTLSFENRIMLDPHRELWLDTRFAPIRDESGRVLAVLGIARDITERRLREEIISHSRREWLRAVDTMPYLLAVVNKQYRFERVNQAMAASLGVSVKDAVGLTCHELLHGGLGPPSFCPLMQTVSDGNGRTAHVYEEHGATNFAISISSVKDLHGNVMGCLYLARDMTESEKALAEKRRREAYMRLLMKSAEYLILIQDEEGKYIYFSAMPSEGLWPWDIVGKTPYDFFDPETAAGMMKRVKRVTKSRQDLSQAGQLDFEGETFHFHENMSPIKDTTGHIKAVVTIWRRTVGVKEMVEGPERTAERVRSLTPRECEILRLIAEGRTNKQIAEQLLISKKTVETHRSMIMRKLALHSTSALVGYAVKSGLF